MAPTLVRLSEADKARINALLESRAQLDCAELQLMEESGYNVPASVAAGTLVRIKVAA